MVAVAFTFWSYRFIEHTKISVPGGTKWACLFDDAMISMRYARNFALGRGLTWNPGEHVEGFTNPFMVLLMAGAARILSASAAVLAMQWLGVALVLATGLCVSIVAEKLVEDQAVELRNVFRALGFIGALSYYPVTFWALEGMETGLVMLLAMASLARAATNSQEAKPDPAISVLLFLLLLTRPDAAVQVSILVLYRSLSLSPNRNWRTVAIEMIPVAIAALGIVVARKIYYGQWVPNTYVLKLQGMPLPVRLKNGCVFVSHFLQQVWIPLTALTIGVAIKRVLLPATALALVTSALAYQWWVGGDPWEYWRIMAPYVPVLLVASAWAVIHLATWVGLGIRLKIAIAVGAFAAGCVHSNWKFAAEITFRQRPYLVDENEKNMKVALELRRVCTPQARLGVIAAGVIGYYTDMYAIDFLGKVDARIARLKPDLSHGFHGLSTVPGHNKYDLNYSIVQLKPDYVQVTDWGNQNVTEFVKENYVHLGRLWLLRGSPNIRWAEVNRR